VGTSELHHARIYRNPRRNARTKNGKKGQVDGRIKRLLPLLATVTVGCDAQLHLWLWSMISKDMV
jgi:hypothetical protein